MDQFDKAVPLVCEIDGDHNWEPPVIKPERTGQALPLPKEWRERFDRQDKGGRGFRCWWCAVASRAEAAHL
jgi:hypothetical protein